MQPAKRLEYTPDPSKFDLRTHVWDAQGALVKKNLYTNHCIEGRQYYERPVQSGNLWYANNQPAGRVTYVLQADGRTIKNIDEKAEHIAFIPKLEGDDALFYALEQEKTKSAALEAEIAAIRAEASAKLAPVAEVKSDVSGGTVLTGPSLTLKKDKA